MQYQIIITNLLDNTPNQPTKFKATNWVERNDGVHEAHNKNSQIKFKTLMLQSSLCDYSHAYIFVSGTITVDGEGDNDAAKRADKRNKGLMFKNCSPFKDY